MDSVRVHENADIPHSSVKLGVRFHGSWVSNSTISLKRLWSCLLRTAAGFLPMLQVLFLEHVLFLLSRERPWVQSKMHSQLHKCMAGGSVPSPQGPSYSQVLGCSPAGGDPALLGLCKYLFSQVLRTYPQGYTLHLNVSITV